MARVRADAHVAIAGFLASVYPNVSLLAWSGSTYPIALFPVPLDRSLPPNAVLGSFHPQRAVLARAFRQASRLSMRALRALGRPLLDLPTFALDRLVVAGGIPRIDSRVGSYFDGIGVAEALQLELLTRVDELIGTSSVGDLGRLPLRALAHRLAGDPLRHGDGRSPAIGISTVLVFKRDGRGFHVLLKERSLRLADAVDRLHVVPSLMFQPLADDPATAFDVEAAIVREYLEEVLGVPEGISHHAAPSADRAFLLDLLARGDACLRLTGVAVDLLTLRPEICAVLVLRTPEWYDRHRTGVGGLRPLDLAARPVWRPGERWHEGLDPLLAVPLGDIERLVQTPGSMVLPAVAALALAWPVLQTLD